MECQPKENTRGSSGPKRKYIPQSHTAEQTPPR